MVTPALIVLNVSSYDGRNQLFSLEDFQAYEETAYLMASPKNAIRLNQAILEVEAGKTKQHRFDET